MNKYTYLAVIQQNYGRGWEDVSEYETSSTGKPIEIHTPATKVDGVSRRAVTLFRHDFNEYKLTGWPTRRVNRKVLNKKLKSHDR